MARHKSKNSISNIAQLCNYTFLYSTMIKAKNDTIQCDIIIIKALRYRQTRNHLGITLL